MYIGNDPAISDSVQNQILECWRRSEPIGTQKPVNIYVLKDEFHNRQLHYSVIIIKYIICTPAVE